MADSLVPCRRSAPARAHGLMLGAALAIAATLTPAAGAASASVPATLASRPAAEPIRPLGSFLFEIPAPPDSGSGELHFTSVRGDSFGAGEEPIHLDFRLHEGVPWLMPPFGDQLLTDRDAWIAEKNRDHQTDFEVDYNRVDRLRLSARHEFQTEDRMNPRVGGRIGWAFDRERLLYGVQLEQPLMPPGRLALGVSMVRRTGHQDLQQVDDWENALALLFFRKDYRDYFEVEGSGAYLAWRVPDFSTISAHVRSDRYRTLDTQWGTRSWFNRSRELRANPPIDDGDIHRVLLRLERLSGRSHRTRAGFYHFVELERAGGSLEGDFGYRRALADARSVLRLSPAATLALRAVMGSGWGGTVPLQRQFMIGGPDGLRAHEFGAFRGTQVALAQAEYSIAMWQLDRGGFEGGLQLLAFADAGRAWSSPDGRYDLDRQPIEADAGFGIATSDDNLRLYVGRDLRHPERDLVVSLRLQQPF